MSRFSSFNTRCELGAEYGGKVDREAFELMVRSRSYRGSSRDFDHLIKVVQDSFEAIQTPDFESLVILIDDLQPSGEIDYRNWRDELVFLSKRCLSGVDIYLYQNAIFVHIVK
jgi:hypothetical protein